MVQVDGRVTQACTTILCIVRTDLLRVNASDERPLVVIRVANSGAGLSSKL